MKPLDPLVATMFPTLARYAKKMKWLGVLALATCIYMLGLHNGLLIGTYRGQVADESYNQTVREFHQFKEDYLKHHEQKLRTTKAQAQVITTQKEKERE